MSLAKLRVLRAAAINGINALFDTLESAEREGQRPRAPQRPPAQPDGEYSGLAEKRAEAIMYKYGIGKVGR